MTLFHYEPDHYHSVIGPCEPVLTIQDGDTVITRTVDAWGYDRRGRAVAERSNPQTGPFYVADATPGDTLAVRFDRLTPDRATGFTSDVVAANVVEPQFVPQLHPRNHITWCIDPATQTARLAEPLPALGDLALPLDPMLGCFGVAPGGGQAISTATSGPHGGNMDYRGFRAGVTAYLPVAAPGALFFLGDGHAVQGDGEIVGTGIETSFEVQFTVWLLKGRTIRWPRGESATDIFTVGNARPLDQAVQHATTEMLAWLTADYGLTLREASILLGQCVRYDTGNIYDPAYTMVCRLAKAHLAQVPDDH